ncbi:MAG: phosphoglucomutase, alpha-D-glucose phosphate-specific, partial [Thalassolituus sp.]
MSHHERAGQKALATDLANIPRLVADYYVRQPSSDTLVSFGTSGHRGSASGGSFNEIHIAAICQALVEYRQQNDITGPLYIGMDTHALSECAFITAVEVLVANGISVRVQQGRGYTPTPVISHAILTYNQGKTSELADGVVITPSHNPPQDGGFKYNPPNGGPADTDATSQIQDRANEIINNGSKDVVRMDFAPAWASDLVTEYDYIKPYVDDLKNVIDMDAIARAGVKIGVDPL